MSMSQMNELIPSRVLSALVRAYTIPYLAWSAPLAHILWPLSRYVPACLTAVVRMARAGSDPPVGSLIAVNDGQAFSMVGRTYCSICSGVPPNRAAGGSSPNAPAPGLGML